MNSFSTGTFTVDSNGEVKVDYLFDGGWFRGEVALFSLKDMDSYEPGSTEFLLEASRRALSGSQQGHIIIQDETEAARFSSNFPWERDFNSEPINNPGEYLGVKTFNMIPGDELGLMVVQNNTILDTSLNPQNIYEFGKLPIFSIPEANFFDVPENNSQMVKVDENGTVGIKDGPVGQADNSFNDIVVQLVGVESNLPNFENLGDPNKDLTTTVVGDELLTHSDSNVFNEGVFKTGATGEITLDFLHDGGLYEGEVGIFSLQGLDPQDLGTEAFTEAAINRTQSNSTQGYVVMKDVQDRARYDLVPDWEQDFNSGIYKGRQTFQMNPGDLFALVVVPNSTFAEGLTADESILSQDPLFSISRANHGNQTQFLEILKDEQGTIFSFEDQRLDNFANRDFNDLIFAIEGIEESIGISVVEELISAEHNWLETDIYSNEILNYFDPE